MRYRLPDQLSACVIGEHAVFLDVRTDRYFRLPEALERAFLAYEAEPREAPALQLIQHGILVPADSRNDRRPEPMDLPRRSALEMPGRTQGCAVAVLPEVLMTSWACRRALRSLSFEQVLERAERERDNRCSTRMSDAPFESALLYATRLFLNARPCIPIAPCCLPDSLALIGFLARRGFHSRIVIGVAGEPFSAHCWVQAGDLALNETVGHAWAHTIIRVL